MLDLLAVSFNMFDMVVVCFFFHVAITQANHEMNVSVCDTNLDHDLWEKMGDGGVCEPYVGTSTNRISPCDGYFTPDIDYVYIPNTRLDGNQHALRIVVEDANIAFTFVRPACIDFAKRLLCTHFYLPCGHNGTYNVPRFICSNVCTYFSETFCPDVWLLATDALTNLVAPQYQNDESLRLPNCSEPQQQIDFLNLHDNCCTNGGIVIPEEAMVSPTSSVTLLSVPITSSPVYSMSSKDLNMSSIQTKKMPQSSSIQATGTSSVQTTEIPGSSSIIQATGTSSVQTTEILGSSSIQATELPVSSNIQLNIILFTGIPVVFCLTCVIILTFIILIVKKSRRRTKRKAQFKDRELENMSQRYEFAFSVSNENLKERPSIPRIHVTSGILRELSSSLITGDKIKLIEKIGQGEFGIVHRALLTNDESGMPQAVAVKTLTGYFTLTDIDSLIQESLKMKSFDHLNVLPLIGVCIDLGDAPYVIMPYMSEGSLLSYLKRERPNLTVSETANENIILNTSKQLLSMCLQVANGMLYLAEQRFVHRDLAARNCMISLNGVIKVADFGLTEDIYSRNYFKQTKNNDCAVKLPIKWMALESLHDGLFTEKTDVWSYGVLCWEVFSVGKMPYPGLDPRGVIDLLDHGGRLNKPGNAACSEEIYSLMVTCWAEFPEKRPSFSDLVHCLNKILEPMAQYMDFTQFFTAENDKNKL